MRDQLTPVPCRTLARGQVRPVRLEDTGNKRCNTQLKRDRFGSVNFRDGKEAQRRDIST